MGISSVRGGRLAVSWVRSLGFLRIWVCVGRTLYSLCGATRVSSQGSKVVSPQARTGLPLSRARVAVVSELQTLLALGLEERVSF